MRNVKDKVQAIILDLKNIHVPQVLTLNYSSAQK